MKREINTEPVVEINNVDSSNSRLIPLMENTISAGFPSPATDYMSTGIDLNKELIRNPSSTFYGRVKGDSMQEAGIFDGDIIVIDKGLEPENDDIAVCFINGEFTLKRIVMENNRLVLMPANKKYKPIVVTQDNTFIVWGIVTYVISKVKK